MNQTDRIKELVELLNKASTAYYNSGHTIMTDEEFDAYMVELQKLEHDTGLILDNSPTQHAGATVLSKQNKIMHEIPMLSLDKLHTVDELSEWAGYDNCYLSLKLDGLSTRLVYENGVLVEASTRGDGMVGSDVLEHVKCYDNVYHNIEYKDRLVIDGESLILYEDFNRINSELPASKQFANARNLASGTLVNLDTNVTKSRHMKFIAWRVIEGFDHLDYLHDSNFFKLKEAERLGCEVVPMLTYSNRADKTHLSDMLHSLRKKANDKGIPIDGVVMAKDSISLSQKMGRTAKFFRHSIAYKFEDDVYKTKLINIEFTLGKTGCLTPTAIFEPVIIDGTTVERASLTNLSIIKKLGLTNNCTVFVKKANCIIPQITSCLQDGDSAINIPEYCPVCGASTEIVTENASEVLMCTNPHCVGTLLCRLKFFVSKPALNIDGLSESTLERFIDLGWVKTFKDIFTLKYHFTEMVKLDGFGKKSATKLLDAIEASRDVKLENFICALSIDGIGKSASKTISDAFDGDFNAFYRAFKNHYDWAGLQDIGDKTASNITKYLGENEAEIVNLASEMKFVVPIKIEVKANPFAGKTLCVTGKLNHFTRDSINAKIAELGAKAASSVSKNCSYLITNEQSGSSKYKKAVELNIPIITEDEFLNMLAQ